MLHPFFQVITRSLGIDEAMLDESFSDPRYQYPKSPVTYREEKSIITLDLGKILRIADDMVRRECGPTEWKEREKQVDSFFESTPLPYYLLPDLEELSISGVPLREIDLTANTKLKSLNAGNNNLTRLDLSCNTALTTLSYHSIPHLKSHAPGTNLPPNDSLRTLILPEDSIIEDFTLIGSSVSDGNFSMLKKVKKINCRENKLTSLKIPTDAPLEFLVFDKNDIAEFDTARFPCLTFYGMSGTRIRTLDLSKNQKLQVLFCSNSALNELHLEANADIRSVNCANNNLTHLDVTRNAKLERLVSHGNKLASLDIRNNNMLEELKVDPKVTLIYNDIQALYLPLLRKKLKLGKDLLKTLALNDKATHYNWDDGEEALVRIIRNPLCDKATALLIYWMGAPLDLYTHYAADNEVPVHSKKAWQLLKEVEKRIAERVYTINYLRLDPAYFNGTYWMTEEAKNSPLIPDCMKQPVRGIASLSELPHVK